MRLTLQKPVPSGILSEFLPACKWGSVLPDGLIGGILTPGASLGSVLDDEADDRKRLVQLHPHHFTFTAQGRLSAPTTGPYYGRRTLGSGCNVPGSIAYTFRYLMSLRQNVRQQSRIPHSPILQ